MMRAHRTGRVMAAMTAVVLCASAPAHAGSDAAQALSARHEALREEFAHSPFERPLVLRSTQADDELKGDVYAVIEQPFAATAAALADRARWCELLILHLNIKDCRADAGPRGDALSVVIGRKLDRAADGGQHMEFAFRVPSRQPDYLQVQMAADRGPLGTRDHRLSLEAAPLTERSSFIHMTYAYGYGAMARMATQAYLATAGRDKVGFTVTGRSAEGKPVYIDGVRGMVERNVMRYYLAIEAYLGALSVPPGERTEKRLRDWFTATERNATQLHEVERDEYLAMKREVMQHVQ
jgi:hypothetical protein